jgi:hypothetical protein
MEMKLSSFQDSDLFGGYIPNPEGTDMFCNLLAKIGHEPDGKVLASRVFDDEKKDVILSHYLMKAFPGWKAGRQAIGDCCSWACAQSVDTIMGVQIFLQNMPEEMLYTCCTETAYGFMRVEVFGKPDYGGDGAYGGAAAKSVMQFGTLHRKKYDLGKGYDFTEYIGSRAKEYGRTGVPDDLEPIAREHIVKTATMVTDFETAAKFIMNGYAILNTHGSNPTCEGSRDSEGFGRGRGYSHAMNYVGVRWGSRPGLLKVNSGWRDTVSGPVGPYELSSELACCSWWEDASICDKVLKGQDSFAFSQYTGFKKQKLPDYGTSVFL